MVLPALTSACSAAFFLGSMPAGHFFTRIECECEWILLRMHLETLACMHTLTCRCAPTSTLVPRRTSCSARYAARP